MEFEEEVARENDIVDEEAIGSDTILILGRDAKSKWRYKKYAKDFIYFIW